MDRNPAWNRGALLLLLAVAVYFQTWSDLWPWWENKNATYTHGTLIAAASLWLVWRARPSLANIVPTPNAAVVPLVVLLSAVWFLAARGNVFLVHAMLWPLLAFTILWAGVGWAAARRFAFPLGLLYFAIPFWEYFKPVLQTISAFMVGHITNAIGVPAHVNGPYVLLPDATIFIALDCSGAHFLSVALALGAMAVKFRGDGLRTGALIIALAGLMSMVFNWLRILLIVLAYLHPDLKHAMETMGHLTFGWWVFALDLVAFMLVLRLLPAPPPRKETPQPMPQQDMLIAARTGIAGAAIAAVAALLLPLSSWATRIVQDYPAHLPSPIVLAGLKGPISPDQRWQPRFQGAAWAHRAAYMEPNGRVIELYRNEYHEQSQGAELVSHVSILFDPAVFATRESEVVHLKGKDGAPLEVTRAELQDRSGREWAALYTYLVGNGIVTSASRAQIRTALQSVYSRPAAGILAVTMPCAPDCESVRGSLDSAMLAAQEAYLRARGQHE
jgi:EpsI family protein